MEPFNLHKEFSSLQNLVLGASKGLPLDLAKKRHKWTFSRIKNFQAFKIWFWETLKGSPLWFDKKRHKSIFLIKGTWVSENVVNT